MDSAGEGEARRQRLARRGRVLMILAFFALSLNMRAPLTSLPPVIEDLKTIFRISGGLAGFLTSIPVLCFGLLTPIVGYLMKNVRLETTVFLTLAGIALGSVLRSAGGMDAAIAGTVVIGTALTAGNIAALLVIGREFPDSVSAMTGLYVCGMSCGSMGTMALTAPLAHALGWRAALAAPALLALAAAALWVAALLPGRRGAQAAAQAETAADAPSPDREAGASPVLRRPLVWILSTSFAAHTFMFYGLTAWMPVYLEQSLGMGDASAGMAASSFQILGLLGCFGIPLLVRLQRFRDRGLFLIVTLSWLLTTGGFWLAPALWPVWVVFGGIGSGGGFTVIFGMIMNGARNLDENRTMSTVVQASGYIIASLSPFAIGHLHELAGNWRSGMALLTGASVLMIGCGLAATRPPRA